MALRKPYTLKQFVDAEVPRLEETLTKAYRVKLESFRFRDPSASMTIEHGYQTMELGQVLVSANGSQGVQVSVALAERNNYILYANAHAQHSAIIARVVDVTQSSISIEASLVSSTGVFSSVTSGPVKVFFQVVGSSP